MDTNALVDEIISRVTKKIQECENSNTGPKVLILTDKHGTICHETLENAHLCQCCHMDCALMMDYECSMEDYDSVVLYSMSNNALSRLAEGMCGSPFLHLAMQAILLGKKVYIPAEEIELYSYQETAPTAYYAMMEAKLKVLQDSGVVICHNDRIEELLLGNVSPCECAVPDVAECAPEAVEGKEIAVDKKIITERDVTQAFLDGGLTIVIREKSILTDLAKDFIHGKHMQVVRRLS